MRRRRPSPVTAGFLLATLWGCGDDARPGAPALVLLDSLAGLDDGRVTTPVYIGPDLVVGVGMSPRHASERHWIIRRDGEGRWAVTDAFDHHPAPVHFGLWSPEGGAREGGDGSAVGASASGSSRLADPAPGADADEEPASAVLAILDEWGMIRPRQALVGGYWTALDGPTQFNRLADNPTGRRLFENTDGRHRSWILLPSVDDRPDGTGAVQAGVPPRRVSSGPAVTLTAGSSDWGLLSDGTAGGARLSRPTGILLPAGLPVTPAESIPEDHPLHGTLVAALSTVVEGWDGATPFRTSGIHRMPGPEGSDWVYVRASRPGSRTCDVEVFEGWVRTDRPDRVHQQVRGTTQCGGPDWPASRPLGVLRAGERHFAVSLEGGGADTRIGITELFAASVGSRRGGATEVASADGSDGLLPGVREGEPSGKAWAGRRILMSYAQPSALDDVPEEIRETLEEDGCLVPTLQWGRQNVVRGHFAAPDQEDWAILCSRDGVSEIRIFWGGEARCPQPVGPSPDRQWLQAGPDSTAVLSRTVGRYTPREVEAWLAYYELDPGIDFVHDVLLDTREGKPVTGFRYCSGGVWITEG